MNFPEIFKEGKQGKNRGLTTGIYTLDEALNGIQKKAIYVVGAAPKVKRKRSFLLHT